MTLAEKVGHNNGASQWHQQCMPLRAMQQSSLCMQVVYGHLDDPQGQDIQRGVSYLKLRPGMKCIGIAHAMALGTQYAFAWILNGMACACRPCGHARCDCPDGCAAIHFLRAATNSSALHYPL